MEARFSQIQSHIIFYFNYIFNIAVLKLEVVEIAVLWNGKHYIISFKTSHSLIHDESALICAHPFMRPGSHDSLHCV